MEEYDNEKIYPNNAIEALSFKEPILMIYFHKPYFKDRQVD